MEDITYRKAVLFAKNGGTLSWRYVDDIKLAIGEEVEQGYYICSKCRGLYVINDNESKILMNCPFCTSNN